MDHASLYHRIRCAQLVSAAERASLTPITFSHLHALAYMAEALATVWDLRPRQDVLKRAGLPFLPALQDAVDSMIFSGLLEVHLPGDSRRVGHLHDLSLSPLRPKFTEFIGAIGEFPEEKEFESFALELALGLAQAEDFDRVFLADASYSDPTVSVRNVIDLVSEGAESLSSTVAEAFETASAGSHSSAGEKVNLYLSLLNRRAS